MEIDCGRLIECFAITPSVNLSWVKTTKGTLYYFQVAWGFWYIQLIFSKKHNT